MASTPSYTASPHLSLYAVPRNDFLASNPHIRGLMAATMVFRPQPRTQPPTQPPTQPQLQTETTSSQPRQEPKTLLIRRAPTDSYPLKWEVPGGSVDAADASILAAATRELREETSLSAVHIHAPIGMIPASPHDPSKPDSSPSPASFGITQAEENAQLDPDTFLATFLETTRMWGKATFLVTVQSCEGVNVSEDEHAEWAWVSEREAASGWLDGEHGERRPLEYVSDGVRRTVLDGFRLWKEMECA